MISLRGSSKKKRYQTMKKKKTNKLTGREIDVLKLVINGDSNSEIAEKLCITDHTVKAHLTHTYKKLGVTNRTSAAIKARDNIIPPQDSEQP